MAETALDLSMTQTAARLPFRTCPESGRISASSAASDGTHDDCISVGRVKAESISPSHVSSSPFSSGSLPMTLCDSHPSDLDLKEMRDERMDTAKGSSDRVAPIRPFKMYPMDTLSMYNPLLAAGAMGSSGLPPSVGLPPMYDSASSMGVNPGLSGLAFTPLTSHLLQRKRRQENRDKEKESSSVTSVSTPATSSNESESEADAKKAAKVVPEDKKDEAYWERRRKNNEAAKRSRDARRQKEEEIALRAAVLEQENLKLRAQVAILKTEMARLHYMLYNRM